MKQEFIPRTIEESVSEASRYFPVITLTGPRQSGKSTLLRHLFPDYPYMSMEDPDNRMRALEDPRSMLTEYRKGVIIDEIQRVPELLSYIQTIVDETSDSKFYITGSSQFSLLSNETQSLAGRTAIFELLPLSLRELQGKSDDKSTDEILYRGFYPAIWAEKNIPRFFYPNYVKTYLERDVRDILSVRDLDKYQRFIRLCAARIGSVFNASELSNELGVSANTVNAWLSVLQASYIIYMLPPFFTNTRKRLTKSPKLYFTDCGLAAYLLEIESPERLNNDKMRGHLFENMVIMEFLKERYNRGKNGGLYFYRDSNGTEVDLLVRNGSVYDCYEIKSSATYHSDFTKGLDGFKRAFPELTGGRSVIYSGGGMSAAGGMSGGDGIDIRNYREVFVDGEK